MRFQIKFRLEGKRQVLPLNYQYPLSSWIYKVLEKGDAALSGFLHREGYRLENGKTFKLFTFSQIIFNRFCLRWPRNRNNPVKYFP